MVTSPLFGENIPSTGNNKSNEWYTPAKYVDAARSVMGGIDLDPASCDFANQTVKAKKYYTVEIDGLRQQWKGRVWLNPPYGKINNRSMIEAWIRKLIREYRNGNVTEAILLTTCDSDNVWFQLLWDYVICFTNHNVHFFKPTDNGRIHKDSRHTQMFGTVFAYFGPNEQRFVEVFSEFGRIAKAIDVPKLKPAMRSLWEAEEYSS